MKEFFLTFKRFLVPIIFIAAVIIFFVSYNTYLVDHSLEDLKFVLDQTAKAQTLAETSNVGMLLDDMLIREVSSVGVGSLDVTNLEFAKNIMGKSGVKMQLKDAEFLLSKLVKEKERNRRGILLALDRMNEDLRNLIRFITKEFPKGALRPEIFKPTAEIDLTILKTAKAYELNWQLKKAISAYEEFINRYPSYTKLRLVELWLADCYFKSASYKEAKRLYEKLIEETPQSDEAKVASVLLAKVEDRIKKEPEKERLRGMISKLAKESPQAKDYNELSIVDSYLEKLDKETKELIVYIMEGAKAITKPTVGGVDLTMLDKAKSLEADWMLKEAQALYEDFIGKYPTYEKIASVKLLLAGVYLKSMQYEKALSHSEGVIKDYPMSEDADLAKRFIEKTKEIISIYKKREGIINSIAKLKTTTELAKAYYNLGMSSLYLFDLEKAVEALKKVSELVPGTELAKKAEFNLGWVYKFGGKREEGIAIFSKFAEKYSTSPLASYSIYHIADSYYKTGRYNEAAETYKKFAGKTTDASAAAIAQLQAGYTYLYDLHDPIKASEVFKNLSTKYSNTDVANYTSLNLLPISERSYRNYGFILLKEGRIKEAEEAFKKALIINNEDAWALCGLSTAYALLAMLEEGVKAATEGLKRLSDEYTHAAMAFAYDTKGEYFKAIDEYKNSIAKNPNYLVSHYNLGRDYIIVGWYDLAIQELREALRLVPDFAEAHNELGIAYWYKGQIVDAEFKFKSAISYRDNLVGAHYNLGMLYENSGKYQKAAYHFEKALSIIPDWEQARRHLERVRTKIK